MDGRILYIPLERSHQASGNESGKHHLGSAGSKREARSPTYSWPSPSCPVSVEELIDKFVKENSKVAFMKGVKKCPDMCSVSESDCHPWESRVDY